MKKILLFLVLLSVQTIALRAQENFDSPIVIGELLGNYDCGKVPYSDTKNTANYTNDVAGSSKDVVYQFTVSSSATVEMDMCNASFDSYLYLYSSEKTSIASNDDSTVCNSSASYLSHTVTPGTYYIVCEGFSSSSGTYTLDVYISNAAPVPDINPLPTITGECSATVTGPPPTASDECDGTITGTTSSPLSYSSPGTYTVVWSYSDGVATTTQNQTVTVTDNTNPVPDLLTLPDVTGECTASIITTPTATDNCSGPITGTTTNSLSYSTQGTHVVTWNYDDGNGNNVSQIQNVIVQDTTDPIAITKDINAYLDDSGNATISSSMIDNGSTDNCAISTIQLDKTSFDCSELGSNEVIMTVTDIGGNSIADTALVNVIDNTNPTVLANDTILYLNSDGLATLTAANIDAGSSDNCSIDTMYLSQSTFDCDDLSEDIQFDIELKSAQIDIEPGVVPVRLTVVDNSGNTDWDLFYVTVRDTISPTATCQNKTVYLDDSGDASIVVADINNGSNDACGIETMVLDFNTFSCDEIGENTVKLTVSDNNGNTDFCTSTVTVEDNTNPTVLARDTTLYLDANGQATLAAADINDGSTDNCSIINMSIDYNGSNPYDYLTPSTSIIKSFAGREVTFNNLNLNETGQNIITAMPGESITFSTNWTSKYVSTYCPGCTQQFYIGVKGLAIDCMYSGSTNITRNGSGYINFTAPTTPGLYVVQAGHSLNYTCTTTVDGISDNISEALAYIIVPVQFDCSNVGENSVTLTVTDASGNLASTNATVTVNDTISPTATCQNITVYLDASGHISIDSSFIDNGSSDVCGIATMELDFNTFSCDEIGENTVKLTVSDNNGNTDFCTSTVTVEDNTNPTVLARDTTLYLNSNGQATLTAAAIDAGSSDNCSIDTMYISQTEFDCDDIGVSSPVIVNLKSAEGEIEPNGNSVQLTVVDGSGNSNIDWFIVTVLDSISPVALCQDTTIYLDANGSVSINSTFIDKLSNDACGIETMELDINNYSCNEIGSNTVTLTVTDIHGNTDFCTSTVTVKDDINPVAIARDTTLYLNSNGQATLTAANIDAGSSDNCSIDTMYLSQDTFDCDDIQSSIEPDVVGLKSVGNRDHSGVAIQLTVEDASGNSDTDWFYVTVFDTISPTASCRNIAIGVDSEGNATITADQIDDGSWDACGIQSMEIDVTSFTIVDLGDNPVVLTVTDNHGNVSTCSSVVRLEDRLAPLVVCNAMDFVITSDGSYDLTSEDIANLSKWTTDNVSAYEDLLITVSPNVFTCEHIGGTTIRVYAEDEAGNGAFCTVEVGVSQMNIAPTINIIADVTANEDALINVDLSGITDGGDCETQEVEITASHTNASLIGSVDVLYNSGDNTGTLAVELISGQTGSAEIIVTVEDEMGASVSDTFMLDVLAVNHAPVLVAPIDDQTVKAETTLELSLSKTLGDLFDDADADDLDFSAFFEGDTLPVWVNTSEDDGFYFVNFAPQHADSGCYNVVVKVTDSGSLTASDTFAVCVQPLLVGVNDLGAGAFEISMYPNPTKGMVTVKTGQGSAEEVEVAVMNIAGAEVFRQKYRTDNPIQFNLSEHAGGIYMVLIEVEGQRVVKKLILDKN